MKTSIIISAALIGLSALTFAANEVSEVKKTINPGNFYGVIVNANANVILTQGKENSIRLEGDEKEIKNIKTNIHEGALEIKGDNIKSLTIYVTVQDINLIEVNGSAKVFASGNIQSDVLLLKANDNGSLKIDIRALGVGMIAKGNGKIIVSGSTGDSYSRIYGNGKIVSDKLDSFNIKEEKMTSNFPTVTLQQ